MGHSDLSGIATPNYPRMTWSARPSLNSLLNLSIAPYTDDNKNKHQYFSGTTDSIVYRIFRENGYRISSGFAQASYLGQKGKYVDEYLSDQSFPFCKFRLEWYYMQFLGFCFAYDAVLEERATGHAGWPTRVLASIKKKASDKNGRWLSYYYVYYPIGHTPLNFSISDEKALLNYRQYFKNQAPRLASLLKELISTVRSRDPNGIILVFGDHGAWLSRNLQLGSDDQFWIQDRHGVVAAIVWNPKCQPDREFVPANRSFTTPSLILSQLLNCISGSQFLADTIPQQKWEHDFSRYLYE